LPSSRRLEFAALAATLGLVGAIGADCFQIGFFADDLHFLDAARRQPFWELLLGQHGVWPWYRPLSRELFFSVLAAAGPAGPLLARSVLLLALGATAYALYRLGERLLGRGAGAVAAAVFATHAVTKFLLAWASGFQDVLATALTLGALVAYVDSRMRWALALAALAPFAKETGFIAGPLIVGYAVLGQGVRRPQRWMAAQLGVLVAALAIHFAVRTTWVNLAPASRAWSVSLAGAGSALSQLGSGFLSLALPASGLGWILGLDAAVAAFALVRLSRPPAAENDAPRDLPTNVPAFLGFGFLLASLAPLLIVSLRMAPPLGYLFYPCLPWLALGIGGLLSRLPRPSQAWVVAALVGVNAWGLSYRAPDVDSDAAWQPGPLEWREATRIAARTARLSQDVREALAQRPESVVVLFDRLPGGAWFQTEDGPAVREALRDPTARSFLLGEAPRDLDPNRVAILAYTPGHGVHLRRAPRDCVASMNRAVLAVVRGKPRAARVWSSYCPRDDTGPPLAPYVRAATALLDGGMRDYDQALVRARLLDSTGAGPRALLAALRAGPDSALAGPYEVVLRNPRSANAHAACADALSRAGVHALGALELEVSMALKAGTSAEHYRLGSVLWIMGEKAHAISEWAEALARGEPREAAEAARRALEATRTGPSATP